MEQPIVLAKAKVARIFAALSSDTDTRWVELVRGGFEASTSIVGGILTAHVDGGEYAVYVGKHDRPRMITLASGNFSPETEAMAMAPHALSGKRGDE